MNMATNQSSVNVYKLIHLLHVEYKNVNLQLSLVGNSDGWKKKIFGIKSDFFAQIDLFDFFQHARQSHKK